MKMSEYEKQALRDIHAWKNPKLSWFGRTRQFINEPIDKASDIVFSTPGIGDAIQASVQGLTNTCNDLAQWSVRKDAIYAEFRKAGHDNFSKEADIFLLNLEDVDKIVGSLATKYKGIALVEGAGAGALGLPAIPPDLVALITLNLRAIGQYATYYGFDIDLQQEKLFALNVLGLASSPTDSSKGVAMAQLVRIAQDVAKKQTWKELERHTFVKVVQQMAKNLGIRLTKAKLAQVIPATGAVVGGGFNAYFTAKVCDSAYFLYRERFLAQRFGADVIG